MSNDQDRIANRLTAVNAENAEKVFSASAANSAVTSFRAARSICGASPPQDEICLSEGSATSAVIFYSAPRGLVPIGHRWPELVRIGQEWPELARNGQNWPELAKIGCHLAPIWSEHGAEYVAGLWIVFAKAWFFSGLGAGPEMTYSARLPMLEAGQ